MFRCWTDAAIAFLGHEKRSALKWQSAQFFFRMSLSSAAPTGGAVPVSCPFGGGVKPLVRGLWLACWPVTKQRGTALAAARPFSLGQQTAWLSNIHGAGDALC